LSKNALWTYTNLTKNIIFFEVNRRHLLASSLAIPVGVLTVLVGALLVIVQGLRVPLGTLEIVQLLLIIICAFLIGRTIYFLYKFYHNYEYGYIATPKELKDYLNSLSEYHEQIGGSQQDADKEFEEYVNSEYAKHIHRNTENNDRKSIYLYKVDGHLILSVVFLMLAGLPYVVKLVINGDSVQKIEIVNYQYKSKGVKPMSEESKEKSNEQQQKKQSSQQQNQQQVKQDLPVIKPTPPPGRMIFESEEPKN